MGAPPMYKFEMNWNRKLAARGEGTAAAMTEIIRGHVTGNFVNVAKCRSGRMPFPSLNDVMALEPVREGEHVDDKGLSGFCADDTGRATWCVWRVR